MTTEARLLSVLYSDADIVIVDKPAGLPTVPAPGAAPDECVRARLARQIGAPVWVVHRLDRDTSGALLFARTAESHRTLCLAFEERRVRKTYVAFTHGVPSARDGRIATPLHPARRGKVRPALPGEAGAWPAVTRYVVRKRWERGGAEVAMVEAHPETGRHHQIRAHLRSIGAPILCDRLYGGPSGHAAPAGAPLARLALHASRLAVPDAAGRGAGRVVEAPLPADLAGLLHWLDATWSAG
jgi:tRNA pseudouridine32 synthase/23S rRNA pseudouridine746 synthase